MPGPAEDQPCSSCGLPDELSPLPMRIMRIRSILLPAALLPLGVAAAENMLAVDPYRLGIEQSEAAALAKAVGEASWREAESILFRGSETDPDNAALLRALGIAHYQTGRFYPAAAALKRADAISPLEREARFLLANSFLRLERRHWARAELEQLLRSHPEHEPYRLALARVHYHQQRFGAGVSELGQTIALTGGSVETYDLLGQCLEGLGRLGEASEAYRQAISLGEEAGAGSAWPHFHLGSLLHDLGDLEQAREALELAASIDPGNAAVHLELGIVLRKAGDLEEAAGTLETAARQAPNDPAIQYALAGVYRELGQQERSASAMRRFLRLSPSPR